jgi:hypothetical protein
MRRQEWSNSTGAAMLPPLSLRTMALPEMALL